MYHAAVHQARSRRLCSLKRVCLHCLPQESICTANSPELKKQGCITTGQSQRAGKQCFEVRPTRRMLRQAAGPASCNDRMPPHVNIAGAPQSGVILRHCLSGATQTSAQWILVEPNSVEFHTYLCRAFGPKKSKSTDEGLTDVRRTLKAEIARIVASEPAKSSPLLQWVKAALKGS